MILLRLALLSLKNRALSSVLTLLSITLSVFLLLTVERARRAAEDGFTQSVSQVDLIVGARSGPVQLILYTVFNVGNATNNISYATYEKLKKHSAVEWTIPYSLGDGHRGFRVVGTTTEFFEHYRFRGQERPQLQSGQVFSNLWDVVVGADVAQKLDYKVGDSIVVSHGVTKGEGVIHHGDKPFKISGILAPTGTVLDRAVYISLTAMEALHLDWQSGAVPNRDTAISADNIKSEDLKIHSITAFFLRTKSRLETLGLQREINELKEEPLLAIIPGATLAELWNGLSQFEKVLKLISLMVVLVGFFAMLIALLTTLNERRREMAILRALGAPQGAVLFLLVFEAGLLIGGGLFLGLGLSLVIQRSLGPWISQVSGLYLTGPWVTGQEILYLVFLFVSGLIVGMIPAVKAYRRSLKDGLSPSI